MDGNPVLMVRRGDTHDRGLPFESWYQYCLDRGEIFTYILLQNCALFEKIGNHCKIGVLGSNLIKISEF